MFETRVILLGENRCQSLLEVKGLKDMRCKVYSPWTDFVCSFPSVLFLFEEVFGAFSVEKGEKYHIMECYLVWRPTNFHLEDKKKLEMMDVSTSVVLSHFVIVSMLLSVLKINLSPFLREEALNENVMRNYTMINFEYFVVLLY